MHQIQKLNGVIFAVDFYFPDEIAQVISNVRHTVPLLLGL